MHSTDLTIVCPFCGAIHQVATNLTSNRGPENGDITMCIECGEWTFFSSIATGGLRKPTSDEYVDIAASTQLQAARRGWIAMKAERDAHPPRLN